LLDTLNKKYDFEFVKKAGGQGPSDHASFVSKKLPVIFFWTDYHPDYHRPTDTSDKINVAGLRKVVDMSEELITHLATVAKRPEYVELASSGARVGQPRLGVHAAEDDKGDGLAVGDIEPGSPAEKAGVKKGDRIVSLAGK